MKKIMLIICSFLLLLCGCSSTPKQISAKDVLLQAVKDSDKRDEFLEDYEFNYSDGSGEKYDYFILFSDDKRYVISKNIDLYGTNNINLYRDSTDEKLYMCGDSDSSYSTMNVDYVVSNSVTDNRDAKQEWFTQSLEDFIHQDLQDVLSYELTKLETGYLIAVKCTDIARYNELITKIRKANNPEYQPYEHTSVMAKITIEKGYIKHIQREFSYNASEEYMVDYLREDMEFYENSESIINTEKVDKILQQGKDGFIRDGDQVSVDGILKKK